MGKFKYNGKDYSIEDLTPSQQKLLVTLKFIKQLANEKKAKVLVLKSFQSSLDAKLEKELGSKISVISDNNKKNKIVLIDGSKHVISSLNNSTQNDIAYLSFVNSEVLETSNILQVLDTAKIVYSRDFSLTLN